MRKSSRQRGGHVLTLSSARRSTERASGITARSGDLQVDLDSMRRTKDGRNS